ncbi:MAG: transketolase family protein [Planctomycetota bacterium]|jgi:transketolase|nr:transketolase family protein [Planctomycetota bacterium]
MKLFGPHEKVLAASRTVWDQSFTAMAEKYPNVIAMTADLSRSICTETFRKKVPDRFFNCGIAEQNMIGMAAGLALCGKIPYCTTFAPFASMRSGEQFRTDACYMGLNVRVIASYGGIPIAGPSHAGLEDAGIIRSFPGATVVSPSDLGMISKIFEASVDYAGPMYIRLGVGINEVYLYDGNYEFKIGKAIKARHGSDATIISFGMILQQALEAALELEQEGIDVGLLDMPTLKPLDREAVLEAARDTGKIVTMEDHSIYNGLGSAISEVLAESGVPCKFKRLGIPDLYPSYGAQEKLRNKYGYGYAAAVEAIKGML